MTTGFKKRRGKSFKRFVFSLTENLRQSRQSNDETFSLIVKNTIMTSRTGNVKVLSLIHISVAIHEMDKMTVNGVFDKDKIALVMDHFIPNKDIKSAEHCKCVREFACKHEITNYFDVGDMGIELSLIHI